MVSSTASFKILLTVLGITLIVWAQAFALPASPMPRTSSPGSPVPPASVREEGLPFGLHQPYLQGITNPKRYANPTTLFINGIAFDTRKGEPALPPGLSISGYPGGTGYYLVQLNGPITEGMRHDLTSRGAQILDYIPNYAYLVRMSEASKAAVSNLDAVTYVGLFQPAYKLAHDLPATLGTHEVNVIVFNGENFREVQEDFKGMGAEIIEAGSSKWCHSVRIKVDGAKLSDIARMPEVRYIEPYAQMYTHNQNAQWIVQDNISGQRRIWYVNGNNNTSGIRLHGEGQVTGTSDSGINMGHFAFMDPAVPVTTFGDYPTHRKVIAYRRGSFTAVFGDGSGAAYHGTHVAGTVCGDDSINGGTNANDGMAPKAKHWFSDIGRNTSGSVYPPQLYQEMWYPAYRGNAGGACRIFSQSWGGGTAGEYSSGAQMWDQFMWDYKDLLGFQAVGAGGGSGTISPPATAKDIVSMGCVQTGSPNSISSFSSRGPVRDGRIKPTVVAPGDPLTSSTSGTNTYSSMSGSSMCTATAAGACPLVRQYFTEGWYPTGSKNLSNGFIPSAALMKAVLVNSGDTVAQMYPNNNYGFGRINLWKVLHFADTTTNNPFWVADEKDGLRTGEFRDYTIPVNTGAPIKVALVWTDYPGPLGVGTAPELVNNLDLRLTDPGGTTYLGNVMTNGESQTGGSPDVLNVEEIARRRFPAAGNWVVRVTGTNCPMGAQPYALVVTGDLNIGTAPQIIASQVIVVNSKNALRPGQPDSVRVTLKNIGTADANGTTGILRSLSAYATLMDSGPKAYGDIPANGGTATQTFRVQCNAGMDCWAQLPFTVRWTSGSLSDNAGFPITANLPDSGGDYVVWGWGDHQDAITWLTMLQKQGYKGWWYPWDSLPALTRPNPLVIIALIPGLEGTWYWHYPVADSAQYTVGISNSNNLKNFLTTSYDSGGLYFEAPEFGYAQIDPTGPRYGDSLNPRLAATYLPAMDLEHGITGVRGVAGTYFSSFLFNYSGQDTGWNGTQGCDIDGIQKTGTGQSFMRFVSTRNDTCLVANDQRSGSPSYRTLTSTWLLRGLVNSGGNTKEAYVDSMMHWLGIHPQPVGIAAGPAAKALRTEFHLGQPNPTTGATTFHYQLAKDVKTSLKIYNLAGQLVRTLVDGFVPAGVHEALWDGRTENGKKAPAGVYLVRFEAGDYQAIKKAVIVR